LLLLLLLLSSSSSSLKRPADTSQVLNCVRLAYLLFQRISLVSNDWATRLADWSQHVARNFSVSSTDTILRFAMVKNLQISSLKIFCKNVLIICVHIYPYMHIYKTVMFLFKFINPKKICVLSNYENLDNPTPVIRVLCSILGPQSEKRIYAVGLYTVGEWLPLAICCWRYTPNC